MYCLLLLQFMKGNCNCELHARSRGRVTTATPLAAKLRWRPSAGSLVAGRGCAGVAAQRSGGRGGSRAPPTMVARLNTPMLLALLVLLGLSAAAAAGVSAKKNVLLLICDDLRTQLKVYGHADYMLTPHIDAFAAGALVFDRAFTNVRQTVGWLLLRLFCDCDYGPSHCPIVPDSCLTVCCLPLRVAPVQLPVSVLRPVSQQLHERPDAQQDQSLELYRSLRASRNSAQCAHGHHATPSSIFLQTDDAAPRSDRVSRGMP
jgi:hypothetical protein